MERPFFVKLRRLRPRKRRRATPLETTRAREPLRAGAVAPSNTCLWEFVMLELVAVIVASAVALSFFTDATSRTVKMIGAARRRGQVRVGQH